MESGTSSIHASFINSSTQKSIYRFLSNPKVSESVLLSKLQQNCSEAVQGKRELAICDTCVINLDSHKGRITDFEGIGTIGRNQSKTSYGYFIHPIYVVDEQDGTPYGMADVHLYNRSMEVSTLSRSEKSKVKQSKGIEEKESYKWIGPCLEAKQYSLKEANNVTFVMDREGDIYDVYEKVPGKNVDVVIRSKENRRILNKEGIRTKLRTELEKQESNYRFKLKLKGKKKGIKVEMKIGSCKILPNQFNVSDKALPMSYVEIKEVGNKKESKIHWILRTNRKLETIEQGMEIVEIYKKRRGIEVFLKL